MKYAVLLLLLLSSTSARAQGVSAEVSPPCGAGTLETESPETTKSLSVFLETLKSALSSKDKQKLADMSAYPLHVATATRKFTIRSREEFMQKYEQIFPKRLVEFLEALQPPCIGRMGAQGFTVGHGEIWFDRYPDGTVRFFSINPVVSPAEKSRPAAKLATQVR